MANGERNQVLAWVVVQGVEHIVIEARRFFIDRVPHLVGSGEGDLHTGEEGG